MVALLISWMEKGKSIERGDSAPSLGACLSRPRTPRPFVHLLLSVVSTARRCAVRSSIVRPSGALAHDQLEGWLNALGRPGAPTADAFQQERDSHPPDLLFIGRDRGQRGHGKQAFLDIVEPDHGH